MLTREQNQQILALLKAAGIKYDEVYAELLDHYAIAVEEKVQKGQLFDQALKEAHRQFGGEDGIKHIQKQYYRQMFKFYRKIHLQTFAQQFQWPHIVGTAIIAILVYFLGTIINNPDYLFIGLFLLAFAPFLIGLYKYFLFSKGTIYSKKTVKGVILLGLGAFGINFFNILTFAPRFFFETASDQQHMKHFLAAYPAVLSVILVVYFLYLLSFMKTLQEAKFKAA